MTSDLIQPDRLTNTSRATGSKRRFVIVSLVTLLAVSVYINVLARPVGPPPGWGDDFRVALATAKETSKPLAVVFYADG